MLFETSDEVKEYLPQNAEFDFEALSPFIKRQGEPRLIKKHLGKVLYDKLAKAYEDNVLTDAMETLLDKVRYPLANYAYLKWLPSSTLVSGKGGISRTESEKTKTPYEYQMIALENACHEAAFDGIEDLLLFLEENIDETEYADWKTSDAYTVFKNCFINTAEDFSGVYGIGSSRRTFLAMYEIMVETEETRLQGVLGKDFYTELKNEIKGTGLSTANAKLLKLIQRATANLTVAKAAVRLPVRITADGFQLISTSDRMTLKVFSQAETDRLSAIITDANEAGEKYLKELEEFIYENIDDYETFKDSATYVDPDSDAAEPWDQTDNGAVLL
jgi:hypothetical protein